MATTRGRLVQNNTPVLEQADFFQTDGFTRVTGLTIFQVTATVFGLNQVQSWVLVDGTNVTNAQIASGNVYWNEIPGAPGYYNVRFMPNSVGYWRLVLTYPAGTQIAAQDYDVVEQSTASSEVGLKASFVRPCP